MRVFYSSHSEWYPHEYSKLKAEWSEELKLFFFYLTMFIYMHDFLNFEYTN